MTSTDKPTNDQHLTTSINSIDFAPVPEPPDYYDPPTAASALRERIANMVVALPALIFLVWPWTLWAIAYRSNGIPLTNTRLANFIEHYPHHSIFFCAWLGAEVIGACVPLAFALACTRLGQALSSSAKDKFSVLDISVLNSLRNQTFPWSLQDLRSFYRRRSTRNLVLVLICLVFAILFQIVPAAFVGLLLPAPFERVVGVTGGAQFDLASRELECAGWLDRISGELNTAGCESDWRDHNGILYTPCYGASQTDEALSAGRAKMIEFTLNGEKSQPLEGLASARIIGHMYGAQGLQPAGNADNLHLPAFMNQLDDLESIRSYSYSLSYQSISANISCALDPESPIRSSVTSPENTTSLVFYNETCASGAEFLSGPGSTSAPVDYEADNVLTYWACRGSDVTVDAPTYTIYLRGLRLYTETIGNITCSIEQIRPSVFDVVYDSTAKAFSVLQTPTSSDVQGPTEQRIVRTMVENALMGMSGIIREAHTWKASSMAESVFSTSLQLLGLAPLPGGPRKEHLQLFEETMKGMLEYGVAYGRFVISAQATPPAICTVSPEGRVTVKMLGWAATLLQAWFLIPVTLLNLASLVVLLLAISASKNTNPSRLFDPADPRVLLHSNYSLANLPESEWDTVVSFSRREMISRAAERFESASEPINSDVIREIMG
ncbi:hypothetical protein FA15DRAFT_728177 [Coprinopsis marcescibilis]|uniref:Uncharacterized protein n=1 Tax=Coprinopsis marcescibilis TaxID=230819 RepID=A0A5C3KFX1_COPMA|nr:hypothetical protein FA15DRAFT_728177 [Coprinopsis marcescibilis]